MTSQSVYKAARAANRLPDALRALEIVGKHIDIQAFQTNVRHSVEMSVEEATAIVNAFLREQADNIRVMAAETVQ